MSWSAHPLVKAFKAFVRQHKLYNKDVVKLVGKDHLGNKYFEADRPNHSRRTSRFFEAEKMDSFSDLIRAANVPPVWDSWLRFKRDDPPSLEEVLEEERYFQMQQAMAAEKKQHEVSSSHQDAIKSTKKQNIEKNK